MTDPVLDPPAVAAKKTSGTKWTEDDYAAAGVVRMNLRMPMEDAALLERLANETGMSRAKLVAVALREWASKKKP